MAKACPDATMDAFLDKIATATRMVACSGEPANFAGIAAVALADVTMVAGDGNDYTVADDTSGRKVTTAAKSTVTIDASGDATHISLDDGANLIYVTTCTQQTLTSGGTVDFPAWKVNLQDPT